MSNEINWPTPAEWAAALRSGQYKQGKGQLKSHENELCCIGVICELTELSTERDFSSYRYVDGNDFVATHSLATEIRGEAPAWLTTSDQEKFINLNDGEAPGERSTFAEIADEIDARYGTA